MPEDKVYVPGTSRIVKTQHGSLLKLGMPAEEFLALCKENTSESGWINIVISPARNPDPSKRTHTLWFDNWKPDGETKGKRDPEDDVPF